MTPTPTPTLQTPTYLKTHPPQPRTPLPMSSYIAAEDKAQKRFAAEDRAWRAPRFFALGAVTLAIAITTIVP